jgi:glycosyltransferase involved in cell wall biosynthesis
MPISEQYLQAEMAYIHGSGLFLSDWYAERHAEPAQAKIEPLAYFCQAGWRAGHQPNPYFDPVYYLRTNPDVVQAGLNPLLHYITHGDREGRDPCGYFHVAWYRERYGLGLKDNALAHFLERRFSGQVAPVPLFDPAFYLETNPDVANAGSDPFEHFLAFGLAELRDPSPAFDMRFYTNRYGAALGGLNPLLHYLANRESGVYAPTRPAHETLIPGAVRRAVRASEHFEEFRPVPAGTQARAKLLAFYLPQFHQFAENDAWWGKGFTDWTNLARGLPRFAGHLQPRVPRDLGFYSLASKETLRRQIELAAGAGVFGFVHYFYWFNRTRLLDAPLNMLLEDESLTFPFCVMWANENWTRRWDGLEREVLIAQGYRAADDEALIDCFAALFADARYIRIDGRPLLMIYRASLIPDAARRIAAWRAMFAQRHNETPIIVMAQSLEDFDPTPYGLDGAVEFPPHKISDELPAVNETLDLLDPEFTAKVYDYADVAAASLAVKVPDYPLIKTLVPGWDNDPRREGKGLVLRGSTPALYQAWLERLADYAEKNRFFGEAVVCVNAWNEWAEGAFLEPDVHFGAAYLNATARALCAALPARKFGLLLVGHDAQPHGAQMLLLHLARHYTRVCGMDVHVLLLGPGALVTQFQQVATVTLSSDKAEIARQIAQYQAMGIRHALVNSAASARLVPALREHGIAATLLVHEMPNLLAEYNLQMQAKLGANAAAHLVFGGEVPAARFCEALGLDLPDKVILHQGNYQEIAFSGADRARIRAALRLRADDYLILGIGFADLRKGFDIFLNVAAKILAARDDAHLVWVGDIQPVLKAHLAGEIAALQRTGRMHLTGFTQEVAGYFSAADIFALTSREDPLPTVVIEAMACGVPVVAFEGSGAVPDILRTYDAGSVAIFASVDDFSAKIVALMDHAVLEADRARLIAMAAAEFRFADYAAKLLQMVRPDLKMVSVCVMNYNYEHYLQPRFESLFAQTYPVAEILFFDDGSDDASQSKAQALALGAGRRLTVFANARNAGSVFVQWRQAVENSVGDYVWLAEADDLCAPEFLARLVEAMARVPDAVMGFTDSRIIDAAGEVISADYKSHYREAGVDILRADGVWRGREFARACLAVQNLIYNVSAVLWRRDALLAALERCGDAIRDWRLAGDWRLYLELLTDGEGSVVYVAEPLNAHRRHGASISQTLDHQRHEGEIAAMHELAAARLGLDEASLQRQRAYLSEVQNAFLVSKNNKNSKVKASRATRSVVASGVKV